MQLPDMQDYAETCANLRFDVPEHYNFGFDRIDVLARDSNKVAYIAVDAGAETIVSHTFDDLSQVSNRFANWLASLGVGQGDFAFVMIPRLPAWYEVMIGCCKAGVVSMPGTNLLTSRDIEHRVQLSKAKLAIVTAANADKLDEIRSRCRSLEHFIVIGAERDGWLSYETGCSTQSHTYANPESSKSTDLMLIYFTSGTTSLPKMVPRNHGYALAHALTGRYWMDLNDADIHWTLSDTGWAKAAWGMLYGPWQMGAAQILYDGPPGFDPDFHLKLIARLGVTTFCAPPTVYRLLAQLDLRKYDLSSIRHSIGAGEPLNPEVIKVWEDATGGLIRDGYGQTETINIVANFPCLPVRPGSMGKPVPGFEVDVVDGDGRPVSTGDIGHIAVRMTDPHPPGLFDGYWRDPEATRKVFHDGWYYTGDTATKDEDGYFWFVGRADDIISSASYRISPFEVESALLEHPAVAESAVVGKPDALRGEIVKAFVVLAGGYEGDEALASEIQDFVKQQTAPYKYPREIEFRESLPKTISGKIRRVELRAEAE
ncbi:MAG: acyl--CoA ligase [Gammaproteobacteria bacterium]|nr:acyl--CoA ligase [Gammaproteobacteria bacterium]